MTSRSQDFAKFFFLVEGMVVSLFEDMMVDYADTIASGNNAKIHILIL